MRFLGAGLLVDVALRVSEEVFRGFGVSDRDPQGCPHQDVHLAPKLARRGASLVLCLRQRV
jgi:hypothetical protein